MVGSIQPFEMMKFHSRVLVMTTFATGGQFSKELVDTMDTKVAIWHSLLPIVKRDPMRKDGTIDEIMFQAHMVGAMYVSHFSHLYTYRS